MKNKYWHDVIRSRLRKYRKDCLKCLYPHEDYQWGMTRDNLRQTLTLVNKLARNIPSFVWPVDTESRVKIADGRWTITLSWDETKRRLFDLKFRNDDHTARVVEKNKSGKYVNYDIGGS
jgi:hypothetical protein